jgi:hypothetical protein
MAQANAEVIMPRRGLSNARARLHGSRRHDGVANRYSGRRDHQLEGPFTQARRSERTGGFQKVLRLTRAFFARRSRLRRRRSVHLDDDIARAAP